MRYRLYRRTISVSLGMDSTSNARRLTAMAVAVAGLMAGWLLVLHLRMIASPAPQEMREGAVVWLTRLLLEGRNPYTLAELPASTNVYGIFYALVVWPLAALLGNSFTVHRTVSGLAIFAACALLYRVLRREQTDPTLAGAGVLLFYASSVYFVGPLARPDGLGVFLAVASIAVSWRADVTLKGYAAGLALAILALLTKPYLAFPPFVLATYWLIFGPRAKGLAYGVTAVAASTCVLAIVTLIFPTYLNLSIAANAEDTAFDVRHMLAQTRDWVVFSLPVIVALGVALRVAVVGAGGRRPTLFAFASFANAVMFAAWLGGHPGAHMTYLFQIVTPVLLPAVLPLVSRTTWARALVALCLPVTFLVNAHYFPWTPGRFTAAEATFARLSDTMAARSHVLGSTEVAGPLALAGRPVLDSGQSEYFWHAASDLPIPGLASEAALWSRWNAFVGEIGDGISNREFDTIVRSRRHGLIPRGLVAKHYHPAATVDLDFVWVGQRWPIDLWEPGP